MKRSRAPFLLMALVASMGAMFAAEVDQAAEKAGRAYVTAIFAAEAAALSALMAPEVVLLPGHEFLKPEHGLTQGDRLQSVAAKREDISRLYARVMGTLPAEYLAKIRAMLPQAHFAFHVADGDRLMLHGEEAAGRRDYPVPTKPGDVVLQFSVERGGQFCVYVLRQIDGKWLVVADYTD